MKMRHMMFQSRFYIILYCTIIPLQVARWYVSLLPCAGGGRNSPRIFGPTPREIAQKNKKNKKREES
jgi:hypothetical protein